MRVAVIVLGDLGRSPRMQYHAHSLAIDEVLQLEQVFAIGYHGESCIQLIRENNKIKDIRIPNYELKGFINSNLIKTLLKGALSLFSIWWTLYTLPHYDLIVIQNPPGLPALIAAGLISITNGTSIILDWHNFGFSMFSDKYGPNHILVRLSKLLECWLGHLLCLRHLCVSRAMRDWLTKNFHLNHISVLYDRPHQIFSSTVPSSSSPSSSSSDRPSISLEARHALLTRLGLTELQLFGNELEEEEEEKWGNSSEEERTLQTRLSPPSPTSLPSERNPFISLRPRRVALLLSSTSWTPDEDFSLLLRALVGLERDLREREQERKSLSKKKDPEGRSLDWGLAPRRVVVVVTGKGPQREGFEREMQRMEREGELTHIRIRTLWLSSEDYPLLVSCADAGVCLHTSTSGLDLPMKVLDMFGASVPALAVSFPALTELVHHGRNGLVFKDAAQLSEQLSILLLAHSTCCDDIPSPYSLLQLPTDQATISYGALLTNLRSEAGNLVSWDANWKENMRPVVKECLEISARQQKSHPLKMLVILIGMIGVLVACVKLIF